MKQSEYGRGLVINLVKFTEHFENSMADNIFFINQFMQKDRKSQELMLSENPPDKLNYGKPYMENIRMENIRFFIRKIVPIYKSIERAYSSQIVTWCNGASDHLYDMIIPKRLKNTKLGRKILHLQRLGLDMGHGIGLMGKKLYFYKDFERLQTLTKEIALMIDKEVFKLKADMGRF